MGEDCGAGIDSLPPRDRWVANSVPELPVTGTDGCAGWHRYKVWEMWEWGGLVSGAPTDKP